MAKKLVYEYIFDASARTIKIYDNVSIKKLLLITNVTDNEIIYNFSDSTKGATCTFDSVTEHTTITLDYDTTSMSDSDNLQIFIEKPEVAFEPSETFVDPVSKIRVSNPENLVDTDFEYGPQASKWETLQLVNNIPSLYSNTSDTTIPNIISVFANQGSDIITVTTKYEHGVAAGAPIDVRGLSSFTAEGAYLVQSVPTDTTFTFRCRGKQPTTGDLSGAYTSIIPGQFYSNSQLILDSYDGLLADSRNYIVTVSSGDYQIDGVTDPDLTITKNGIYYFTQDSADNTSHRLKFARLDKVYNEFTKQMDNGAVATYGNPVVFGTNDTTVNVMASDNGHIYTSSTSLTEDGSTWNEVSYTIGTGSLPTGPIFKRGLYIETLGMQVRVGESGLIATSTDNINWDVRTTGTSNDLEDIDWDGGFITVVGASGTVLRSSDGVTWAQVTGSVSTTNYKGVRSNSASLVIVGDGGVIRTSTDGGANWTLRTTSGTQNLSKIEWNGSQWLTVGASGAIYTSADATTWTLEGAVGTSNNLTDVAWDTAVGYEQWVVVGASGTLLTSADGSAYTTRSTGLSNTLTGVACGDMGQGYRIVIIDDQGDGAQSDDYGASWVAFTTGTGVSTTEVYWTGYTWNILQHTGTGGSTAVSTYFDAINNAWTAIPSTQIQFGASGTVRPRDIVWVTADNQFVLVGDTNGSGTNGAIFVSSGGTSWTEKGDANIPNESFLKVVYDVSTTAYYMLTADKVHKTSDGTTFATWTEVIDKSNITINSGFATDTIVNGGSTYQAGTNVVLTTMTGDGSGALATVQVAGGVITDVTITTAGKNYKVGDRVKVSGGNGDAILEVATVGTSTNSTTSAFKDLSVRSNDIVIVGTDSTVVHSSNGGTSFEVDALPVAGLSINSIAYDDVLKSQYVICCDASDGKARIFTSSDPETWTATDPDHIATDKNLVQVVFDTHRYLAVGEDGTVITSYDAKFWDKVDVYGQTDNDINFIGHFKNTSATTGTDDRYVTLLVDGDSGSPANDAEAGVWMAKDAIREYSDDVYLTSVAPGNANAYTRIFVNTKTPKYLRYYCQQHGLNMGAMIFFKDETISKIFMKTEHENGFSTGTDFYVVNTVSPKVLEVKDGSVTAADNRPNIDTIQNLSIDKTATAGVPNANAASLGYDQPEQVGNQIMGYRGSYEIQFGPEDVNYSTNTISFDEDHKLHNGAALYYYPMPGDKPVAGLQRGMVYYVRVVSAKSIALHQAGYSHYYYDSGVKYEKMQDYDFEVLLGNDGYSFVQQKYNQNNKWQRYHSDNRYGCSHAMSGDGKTCVVGARYTDWDGTNRGEAYVYQRNEYTGEFDFKQRLLQYTSRSNSDYFGQCVRLNYDGTRLIVSAPADDPANTDAGAVYVYDRANTSNNFDGKYRHYPHRNSVEPNYSYSYYGSSMDMDDSGEWLMIGIPRNDRNGDNSGTVHMIQQTNFNTNHPKFGSGNNYNWDWERVDPSDGTKNANDYYGQSVTMTGDYSKCAVGSPYDDQNGDNNSGSVYVFNRGSGNTWSQAQRINSPASAANDYFGGTTVMSKDGSCLLISSHRKDTSQGSDMGQVYFYKFDTGTSAFTYRQTLELPNITGATNFYYNKSEVHFGGCEIDGTGHQDKGDGTSIAISRNGERLFIGAEYYDITDFYISTSDYNYRRDRRSNVGAAFSYRLDEAGTGYDVQHKFLSNYARTSSQFGGSMACDDLGEELVIGCSKSDMRNTSTGADNTGHSEWYSLRDAAVTSRHAAVEITSFSEGDDTLTVPSNFYNQLRDGDVVNYFKPGTVTTTIGGLTSGTNYYVYKNGSNTIKLAESMDNLYAPNRTGTSPVYIDLTGSNVTGHMIRRIDRGATFKGGKHRFALCYRIQREEKSGSYQWYYRTTHYHHRQYYNRGYFGSKATVAQLDVGGSGYDLSQYGTNSYGLAGTGGPVGSAYNVENSMVFSTYSTGPGYGEHNQAMGSTGAYFGGGHANHQNLGWSDQRENGNNIFPVTFGIMDHRNNPMVQPRSYSARTSLFGRYGASQTEGRDSSIAPAYCTVYGDNGNPYTNGTSNDAQINIWGNRYAWRRWNYERDVSSWNRDWYGRFYWMPLTKVPEQDTIYAQNHQLSTNNSLTFNVTNAAQGGEGLLYNNNTGWNTSSMATLNDNTTVYVEVVDENRFRVKTSISGQPLRMLEIRGDYRFSGNVVNSKANSIFVPDHNLSENNRIIYTNEGTAPIGGLVSGNTYYVDVVTGDRFSLRNTVSLSFTGRTSTGQHYSAPSNRTRINRLSIQANDFTVGQEVDMIANFQNLEQVGRYEIVNINNGSIGNDNNWIELDNQWGGSGSNIDNISFRASDPSITLTGTGTGQQAFEDQTSDFGVSDGGYKNTVLIDERTLEINVPFKVRPTKKLFDTISAVNVGTDVITVANHFLVTGQKVIYSNNGGNTLGGLVSGNDYYVIQLDDDEFKLASTRENAIAGTAVDITSTTGVAENHTITHANVAGRVLGAGQLEIVSGTRRILGSQGITNVEDTNFKRYFKVGDTIRVIDTTTSPSTIHERLITAIKDDFEMLVDQDFTFDDSTAKYFIDTLVYVRPDGYYLHRPFDGGMEIGSSKSPDGLICRQTRKYFRYQSGKGIQTSLAINFSPKIPCKSMNYVQVAGDVYGNVENYTTTTAANNTAFTFAGDQSGDNIQITLKAGDKLTINNTGATNTMWIVSQTASSGLGASYAYNVPANQGITGNGTDDGTIVWDTTDVVAGTYYYISEENPDTMRGEIVVSVAADGAKNRLQISSKYPHNINLDSEILIADSQDAEYNNETTGWKVINLVDDFTFQVDLGTLVPSATQARGFLGYHMKEWSNAAVRCGMFDFQNGFFFEYDGQDIYCVRRSSTQQMTGTVSVSKNSNLVTGLDTQFATQVAEGDKVVIRGQTYKVVKVTSNTTIKIQPTYRGTTTNNVLISKTIDTKVAQSNWNIDHCDGTGESGYNLDLTKIQMAYMDYSWYGAGKIRFGFKDQNGHVKYVHEFRHNNRLTESYFRSGNLPARYEIESTGIATHTPTLFHWGTSVMMDGMFQDDDAYLFTASGNLLKYTNQQAVSITSSGNTQYVYSIRDFGYYRHYIVIRFTNTSNVASNAAPPGTYLYNDTLTGILNGFFKDGRPVEAINQTRISGSYYYAAIKYVEGTTEIFSYWPLRSNLNRQVPGSTIFFAGARENEFNEIDPNIPIISIRLSPSVDSSIQGILGEREIINRMQLKLNAIDIQTSYETEIELRLNGALSSDSWYAVDSPSLSQLISHEKGDTISGGLKIFTFRAAGGTGSGTTETTTLDLSKLIDLGNSIQGGDGVFPNGPDVLTIVANIIDSSEVDGSNPYTISGKISWAESQA